MMADLGGWQSYDSSLKMNPNDPAVYTNRAMARMKLQQFKEAEQDCCVALPMAKDNKDIVLASKILYRRGCIRRQLGKLAEAIKDLHDSLKLQPNVPEVIGKLQQMEKELQPPVLVERNSKPAELVPSVNGKMDLRRMTIQEVDEEEEHDDE